MELGAGLARTALGDAWQMHGLIRGASGGDVAELPGVRLMTSGLPHPQWNSGDVDDPSVVDLADVASWYADRGREFGLRVAPDVGWSRGRFLFRQRLMLLAAHDLVLPAEVVGVDLRPAGPADLDAVFGVDSVAYEDASAQARQWVAPHLAAAEVEVALASCDGRPVGTAYCMRTSGRAGPAAYLGGVAVLPDARRRGIAAAMSAWLLRRAFEDGAAFAHLHPDDDRAARVYQRLGFVEVDGIDIYVDLVATG
jgi:ribosomal protein S18 acetylase RimI-like enzyme